MSMDDMSDVGAGLPSVQELLGSFPLPIMVYNLKGIAVVYNQAAEAFWQLPRDQVIGTFNFLEDPRSVEQGSREVFARVLAGEAFEPDIVLHWNIGGNPGKAISLRPFYFPLRNAENKVSHVAVAYGDITPLMTKEEEIRKARESLAFQEQLIYELSSPVVRIWQGIVLLPLVGTLDARRSTLITERLLEALVRYEAAIVIIDITGVPMVDTATAQYLMMAARAAGLLGSEAVIVGISSEIAQTIVQLGIDLSRIVTRSDLQAGLAYAFSQQRLDVIQKGDAAR